MKNVKNSVCIVFLLLFVLCNLWAWQNTYGASDEVFENLILLKSLSGVNLPDVTAPVSGSQIGALLEMIDSSKLDGYAREIYEELKKEISHPPVLFSFNKVGGNLNVSFLPFEVIGSTGDSNSSTGYMRNGLKRFDLYDVDAQLYISENFYGRMLANGTKIEGYEKKFAEDHCILNTVFSPENLSQAWPEVAFGSIGNSFINLIIGRDRLSAGSGITGNLYLSENRRYDDFLKFSAVSYPLSYDFTAIVYDGFTENSFENGNFELRTTDFDEPRKVVLLHRFSSTILKKITLSAFEGAVVYCDDIWTDIRAFNPFMFIHNNGTYYTGNTNNFAGMEISAALGKGINANAQIILDQFKLSSESSTSGDTQYGVLANINGTWSLDSSIVSAYIEGIYETKGLYLKEVNNSEYGYNYNDKVYYYAQIDMVSGNKRFSGEKDEYAYLGYPDGGDLKKLSVGLKIKKENAVFAFDASVSEKGVYGIHLPFNEVRILTDSARTGFSSSQYCYSVKATADATFFKGVDCCATLGGFYYKNYLHEKDVNKKFLQFSIGCKVDPTLIFIRRNQL